MDIEIKHLAPYLPYGLKGLAMDGDIYELTGITSEYLVCKNEKYSKVTGQINQYKPILHPISDLDKLFMVNGEEYHRKLIIDYFIHSNHIYNYSCQRIVENRLKTNTLKFLDAQTLFKFHFDVFGLIEQDLAYDINNFDIQP